MTESCPGPPGRWAGWATAAAALLLIAAIVGISCGWWNPSPPAFIEHRYSRSNPPKVAPPKPDDRIHITVRDANNSAITDASVVLMANGVPLDHAPMRTNTGGWVAFRRDFLEGSGADAVLCSMGPLQRVTPLPKSVPLHQFVNLPESFALRGRVVSKSSGAPIAAADIRHERRTVQSSPDGSFLLAIAPHRQALDGAITLHVRSPGGSEQIVRLHWQKAVDGVTPVEIE